MIILLLVPSKVAYSAFIVTPEPTELVAASVLPDATLVALPLENSIRRELPVA